MQNMFSLIGKITSDPVTVSSNTCIVPLSVQNTYTDATGNFPVDVIEIYMRRGMTESLYNMTGGNEWVSIQGHIEIGCDVPPKIYMFVAEKVNVLK